ncbi:hypothetical protein FB45DRAFT_1010179 [Roridomyces roridus]|uniref:F-box domain-containing protein n=1 Tax=Roridomyces roridus TaxID=1738132 RepID=A0AAD7B4T4_9AGAR|nr:hypothetical protein FB45DRAFT_1010179 [Roridomyces roridus]
MSSTCELRTEISLLDQELSVLDAQIALVRAKRVKAAELLQAMACYPVLSLPNEITSEFFTHYVNGDEGRSPLPLTWVCRGWRELTHSCCRLWTCFDSKFYAGCPWLWSTFDSRFHHVDQMSFWLHLSGGRPLDLILGRLSPPSKAQAQLANLNNYSTQFRTFESLSPSLNPFVSSLRGPFPVLEKLQLPFGYKPSTPSIFLDALRLRKVEILVDRNHNWRGVIPWGQLTTLHLSSESPISFLETVKWTPQLEELRLGLKQTLISPLPSPSTPPIVLPRLRTLSFENTFCCGILQHLTLPALEDFATDFEDWHTQLQHDDIGHLMHLFERSKCALRNLRLKLAYNSVNIFMELLLTVPLAFLRELIIRRIPHVERGSVERLLDCLTSRNPPLLPCLESIRLEGCDVRIRLPPLVRMLTARRAGIDGVAILQTFYLWFSHNDGDDESDDDEFHRTAREGVLEEPELEPALLELRRLREGGLRVEMHVDTKCFTGNVDTDLLALMAGEDLPACGLPFLLDPGFANQLTCEDQF